MQGFDKQQNGASERCKGTENWYSEGVTVRHYHPTRIKRLDAAIAGRHATNPFHRKKTVDFGCIELISSCSSLAASCRGLPTSMPTKMFQRSKGKQDFLLGVNKNLAHS